MKNVRLDGIQEDLTAPGTPWIYYGVGKLSYLHYFTSRQGFYSRARMQALVQRT